MMENYNVNDRSEPLVQHIDKINMKDNAGEFITNRTFGLI